ncbi:MAG: AAA family ATPase [Eubacteriales bacterium]|nr:AAA family ATPase [Eubacteriales bacterium]
MKILTAQGHFGVLDGREIRFEDGLNVLYLPNEGGKSTLCNFLRVMLYGLNTSRRDSRKQLSDKTRYRPIDGNPMSGRLELEWKGRRVVISRQTGKGNAPMQEFSAYYADTGEPCTELTAKDCGKTLTGVSEEGFQSSALLDGQEQSLSAGELGDRMLALSTTGDSAMMYSNAAAQLDHWKNALRGTGKRGRYAQVEADIEQLDQSIARLDDLTEQIKQYEAQIPEAENRIAQAEQGQQQATEEFTLLFVAKREAAEREERRSREELTAMRDALPPFDILAEAERVTSAYLEAKQKAQAAREELETVTANYQKWKDDIDHTEDDYSNSARSTSDIRIRGWSMVLAVLFGIMAVVSLLQLIPFGPLTSYMPYLFSVFAIIALIVTFVGSTRSLEAPPMDFDEERVKLERRKQSAIVRNTQTTEQEKTARGKFWEQMHRIAPGIPEEQEQRALQWMQETITRKGRYLECKREHEALAAQYLEILDTTGPQGDARMRMNEAKEAVDQARQSCNALHEAIAVCRGKCEEIGVRKELCAQRDRLEEEKESILWQLDAIRLAKESLVQANAELTGRVSPQINQLAQEYLKTLTADRYTAMQLYTDFEATCRRDNSAVEMDRLRLSTGTRDQLYLALRLAVCKVLLDEADESVPIILDDPFVNYDDERTACGMKLLREIAHDRQVILLTCRRP